MLAPVDISEGVMRLFEVLGGRLLSQFVMGTFGGHVLMDDLIGLISRCKKNENHKRDSVWCESLIHALHGESFASAGMAETPPGDCVPFSYGRTSYHATTLLSVRHSHTRMRPDQDKCLISTPRHPIPLAPVWHY